MKMAEAPLHPPSLAAFFSGFKTKFNSGSFQVVAETSRKAWFTNYNQAELDLSIE